jgi:hypothetical protein
MIKIDNKNSTQHLLCLSYRKHNDNSTHTKRIYRCTEWNASRCRGRVVLLVHENMLVYGTEHNHGPPLLEALAKWDVFFKI